MIVTNATGKLVEDYLQEKLFRHMGIRNYHWDISVEGYNMGGWGLYITTEALAKMGQFFLQKGEWNGKQLLNKEWMMTTQTAMAIKCGYAPTMQSVSTARMVNGCSSAPTRMP